MVDIVRPLKVENTITGSQENFGPTEVDPTEDYLAAKGIAFYANEATSISRDELGNILLKDNFHFSGITLKNLTDSDTESDQRLDILETIDHFEKNYVYENNAQVYADSSQGVEDEDLRDGWYFENAVAGTKFNWYFYDGLNNTVELQDYKCFAIVTFDSIVSKPYFAIYTRPTGTNDVIPSFAHSVQVYSVFSEQPVVGKKYLIYIGQDPNIHLDLPRIELTKNSAISYGEQLPTEIVLTCAYSSDSGSSVGNVKLLTEYVGSDSPDLKQEVRLRIRQASLSKLYQVANTIGGTDILTIGQQEVDNKQVTLSSSPSSPNSVSLTFLEGIEQDNGIDFIVNGNILSWDGLGLDGFIEVGDVIIVRY
jgi:hypothetical protein